MKATQPPEQRPFASLQPPGLTGLSHYLNIELRQIIGASPLQVRAPFDPEADEQDRALLDSLASDGQRLPVLLLESSGTTPPTSTPLDGHRRIDALRRLQRHLVKIAEGQTVTEADAKRWVDRLIGGGETPEQAARAVGLIAAPPMADAPAPTPAAAAPEPAHPPTKARVRREAALN